MRFQLVDITTSCYRLGIDLEEQGSRLVGFCPFHSEENPSFMVYSETNSFYCFSCQVGGGPLQLVSRLVDGVVSWPDLNRWYSDSVAVDRAPVRKAPALREVESLFMADDLVILPEATLSKNAFLATLGITYVKEGKLAGRHIVPIQLNGQLIAYEARDFVGGSMPKTLVLPPGVGIHSYLWNIDSVVSGFPIIVVEGTKGAIAVMQFGYSNVVSSFGSRLSADQVSLLLSKSPSEVIIAYDADLAGIDGAINAAANLLAWVDVYDVSLPDGTDPWDVSNDVWDRCMTRRTRVRVTARNKAVLAGFQQELSC